MEGSREIYGKPNGGWGWMVVLGGAIINVVNQSLLSVFGLLFGGYFSVLNESKIRIALVMNLCSTFLNLTGLMTATLMKNFSTREIAISGCFLVSFGLMLSSLTTSLNQIIVTYSICVGIGLGLLSPAIFITINDYFTTKRSRAAALTMAGTGLGQMVLPQIVKLFLSKYGFRGTLLLMGSLSLHGVVGASFFRPAEWSLKKRSDREALNEREPLIKRHEPLDFNANEIDNDDIGLWKKIERSMDLTLLNDPRFLILNFGLACSYTVSIDFALVLPFFLQVSSNLY